MLWLRGRRGFWQWTYRFVPQCLIGFTFFALAPTAPPWAAARCSAADVASRTANPPCISQAPARTRGGLIGRFPADHHGASPYVQRLTSRALDYLHFHPADSLLHTGQATSDQVAAVPSLHSAGAMLFAIFMWPRVRPPVRVLLVAYPVAMGFVLVYTGEHYVTDVLLGWLVAAVVSIVAALLERRFAARRTPQRQPGEVDTAGVA